jgi:hypothetical protein
MWGFAKEGTWVGFAVVGFLVGSSVGFGVGFAAGFVVGTSGTAVDGLEDPQPGPTTRGDPDVSSLPKKRRFS